MQIAQAESLYPVRRECTMRVRAVKPELGHLKRFCGDHASTTLLSDSMAAQ